MATLMGESIPTKPAKETSSINANRLLNFVIVTVCLPVWQEG
jgi:hypothetical protein